MFKKCDDGYSDNFTKDNDNNSSAKDTNNNSSDNLTHILPKLNKWNVYNKAWQYFVVTLLLSYNCEIK